MTRRTVYGLTPWADDRHLLPPGDFTDRELQDWFEERDGPDLDEDLTDLVQSPDGGGVR